MNIYVIIAAIVMVTFWVLMLIWIIKKIISDERKSKNSTLFHLIIASGISTTIYEITTLIHNLSKENIIAVSISCLIMWLVMSYSIYKFIPNIHKWIRKGSNHVICSNCNAEVEHVYPYCPCCGVKKDCKRLKD